MPGPIVQVQDP